MELLNEEDKQNMMDEGQMNDEEFIAMLAKKLKESNKALLTKLVRFTGRPKAIGFLERVIDIQNKDGGMKNEQFNGFKTPGGVFIYLVKNA